MFSIAHSSALLRLRTLISMFFLIVPVICLAQDRYVAEIKITGNDHVSSDAILAVLEMKPGQLFSEEAVQKAKQAIEDMGYFQPGVTVATESIESGVRVIFTVVENPIVKDIQITGNTVVSTEKLRSLIHTEVGKVLNMNTLRMQDIDSIERYYAELGYLAYVTEEAGIDPDTGILRIPIVEVRIESIEIVGNKKTKSKVILREMEQKVGDVYNEMKLARDLQRIFDIGIFEAEGTSISKPQISSDLSKVRVTITVKERKAGEVSLGLGYSSKQGLVGQAKVTDANFRGLAQSVEAMWEQSGSRGASYELGFYEPWLDAKHTSIGVNLYNKLNFRFASNFLGTSTGADTDYDERRKGGKITLGRPFGRTNRGFFTVRSESVKTDLQGYILPMVSSGTVNSGALRFTNDLRDSVSDPFVGSYKSYSFEAGKANFEIQSMSPEDTFFTKYSIDYRWYFSKGGPRRKLDEQRRRLALRVTAGSLTGNVPFFEQYFVGGAESLRGYKEDRFWGKNMFLVSGEYRCPLGQSLTGVLFLDYGDAWGAPELFRTRIDGGVETSLIEGFEQHESFSPSIGYGLGLRVVTPIGPIRIDYGFGSEGSRAHLSFGHAF